MGTASRQLVGRINDRHGGMESSHIPKLHSHPGAKDSWPLLFQHRGTASIPSPFTHCAALDTSPNLSYLCYKDEGSWKVCCTNSLKYGL